MSNIKTAEEIMKDHIHNLIQNQQKFYTLETVLIVMKEYHSQFQPVGVKELIEKWRDNQGENLKFPEYSQVISDIVNDLRSLQVQEDPSDEEIKIKSDEYTQKEKYKGGKMNGTRYAALDYSQGAKWMRDLLTKNK